jgi:hypothetical protein
LLPNRRRSKAYSPSISTSENGQHPFMNVNSCYPVRH